MDVATQLDYRRSQLPNSEEIKHYVEDLRTFLENGDLPEKRSFIQSFIREVKVLGDDVFLTYSVPMPPKGHTSEWVSVLATIQFSDPYRTEGRTFSLRFSLAL